MLLAVAICGLALDIFVFRPSGVYAYTKVVAHSLEISMTKKSVCELVLSNEKVITQLRTKEPFHMQNPLQDNNFEYTPKLLESNYWLLYASGIKT